MEVHEVGDLGFTFALKKSYLNKITPITDSCVNLLLLFHGIGYYYNTIWCYPV